MNFITRDVNCLVFVTFIQIIPKIYSKKFFFEEKAHVWKFEILILQSSQNE